MWSILRILCLSGWGNPQTLKYNFIKTKDICSSMKMHISTFRLRIFREINARTNRILFTIMQICKLLFSSPSSYNSWMRCCCLLFCKWGAILACKINGQHDWRLALYPSKWNTKTRESYTWPNCTKISWF